MVMKKITFRADADLLDRQNRLPREKVLRWRKKFGNG